MVSPAEAGRRVLTRWTGRVRSLPILALSVHSACNCRCVMCDIWKANAEKREISLADLERHAAGIRALRVRRVMLTGGEPLLHSNLWALCDRLRADGIRLTLVTTGLLVAEHAEAIRRAIDELVVSIDGPPDVHDAIRRVRGGFDRIAVSLAALGAGRPRPRTTVRSVVQRANHTRLADAVEAVRALGVDRLSFLAADVTSQAFNRPQRWDAARRAEVLLTADETEALASSIREVEARCRDSIAAGFLAGGTASLWRIHAYYRAMAGRGPLPRVRCNAPWVSAVLEPGGRLRPCFFHAPYGSADGDGLSSALNGPRAVAFRRTLSVATDDTCRHCVCSLSLPIWAAG
jgi:MoaA/NifB/PqqE/SkfB family radical SAM enzyme